MNKPTFHLVIAATAVAVALRLVDQPMFNFSAMGALALLCGAAVRPAWLALLIPLAARAFTDVVLEYRTGHGVYGSIAFDYAAYASMFLLGRWSQPRTLAGAFGTGLFGAITFFLISNFGVWCMPHEGQYLYAHTMAGLANCFTMAIPFAKGTLAGDIGFALAFFGAWQLLTSPEPRRSFRMFPKSADSKDLT